MARGDDAYANVQAALRSLDPALPASGTILVKPNAGRMRGPGEGVTTSPAAVAAVLDFLRARTRAELCVGESPIRGVAALAALEKTGIADVARERGVRLVDLDAAKPVSLAVPDGRAVRKLKVCRLAAEAACIVSVPVMKTHMHTVVSLSAKNMKGCLYRKEKVRLHQLGGIPYGAGEVKSLDLAIAEMGRVLRPALCVIDGAVGLEGFGPSAGAPKRAGLALAGTNAVSTDAVAAFLMGIEPGRVPHLALAARMGLGEVDLNAVAVTPGAYRTWRVPFALPPTEIAIEYPGVVLHDRESCSACLSTVALFLEQHHAMLREYALPDAQVHIAIGKAVQDAPPGTLFIGNCTRRHAARGIFVKGCPPVSSYILDVLKKPSRRRR
ncbi:MAG: DUF362 domain-containing protein [Kiritimatiellae bacterium]|nr:DUF362 domain-containing protein [Kiritimatiellia bacterium]